MQENMIVFAIGLGVSLMLCLLVVSYLNKPLKRILVELCGTEERATFWVQITHLSFVLMALLMALGYQPDAEQVLLFQLSHHLSKTLIGMLVITGFLALTVSRFIRRREKAGLTSQQS
jgi:hypothetical protein